MGQRIKEEKKGNRLILIIYLFITGALLMGVCKAMSLVITTQKTLHQNSIIGRYIMPLRFYVYLSFYFSSTNRPYKLLRHYLSRRLVVCAAVVPSRSQLIIEDLSGKKHSWPIFLGPAISQWINSQRSCDRC